MLDHDRRAAEGREFAKRKGLSRIGRPFSVEGGENEVSIEDSRERVLSRQNQSEINLKKGGKGMKVRKLVGILGTLALLSLLTVPMVVSADSEDTTTVEGNPTPTILIDAPAAISSWSLSIGANDSSNGTLNVNANDSWTVTAKDADTTNTNGFMTSWNSTAYDTSTKLVNALHVKSTAQGKDVTLPTAATIATGVVGDQDGDNGENITDIMRRFNNCGGLYL